MPAIKLRITGAVDANIGAQVFKPLVKAAGEARTAIKQILAGVDGDLAKMGRALGTGGGRGAGAGGGAGARATGPEREAERQMRQLEKIAERHRRKEEREREKEHNSILAQVKRDERAAERAAESKAKASEKATDKAIRNAEREAERRARALERSRDRENNAIQRDATRDERAAERKAATAQRAADRDRDSVGKSRYGSFTSTVSAAASRAVGVAGDIARGAGIDFSLASGVRKRVELQSTAIDLANSAYQEQGVGIQTRRVDPRDLMLQAQEIGAATGNAPGDAMAGLAKFTAITGDLATARAALPDLARLAKATGANLSDVVATAGEFSKTMGEAAESEDEAAAKARKIYDVMKGLAGGGKLGSVELADTAKHGARVAAATAQFSGDSSENALKMAAIMQEARGGGGSWNAATAAGAVTGLVTTLKTPARLRAFKNAPGGEIKVFDKDNKIRDPFAILTEAIEKTNGDPKKLQGMFANVVGARAMQQFANTYLAASGGGTDAKSKAAGTAALRKEMDRMTKKAMMSDVEVSDSFGNKMGSLETKAELFQQNLDKISGDMAEKLMPALLQLAPQALDVAKAFSHVATTAAKNPGTAAAGVVALGGAKAVFDGVGAEVGKSIAAALSGSIGLAGITALTIGTVTALAIEKVMNDNEEADKNSRASLTAAFNAEHGLVAADRQAQGIDDPVADAAVAKARSEAMVQISELRERITRGQASKADEWGENNDLMSAAANSAIKWTKLGGIVPFFGGGQDMKEYAAAEKDAEQLPQLQAQLDALESRLADSIAGKTLRVQVINMPASGLGPSGEGRTGQMTGAPMWRQE